MTALTTSLVPVLAALKWDPQIRGALILLIAVVVFPGSVYLLLSTNLGSRVGFLLAIAGLSGWIGVMAVIWQVYGIGLRGTEPHWDVKELVTSQNGELDASTVEAVRDFPGEWRSLRPSDSILADAQAAADKALAKSAAEEPADAHGGGGGGGAEEEPSRFEPPFDTVEDYTLITDQPPGYMKGGDNELFTIGEHKFFFRRSARYVVLRVRPVIEQPDFGGAPPRPAPDTRQPVTSVIMVRDAGNLRLPPFILALSSFTIFGVTCWVLHQRDKEIWRAKAQAEAGPTVVPEPEPEPAGVT